MIWRVGQLLELCPPVHLGDSNPIWFKLFFTRHLRLHYWKLSHLFWYLSSKHHFQPLEIIALWSHRKCYWGDLFAANWLVVGQLPEYLYQYLRCAKFEDSQSLKPSPLCRYSTLHLSDAVLVLGLVSCSTVLHSDLRLSEVTLLKSPNFCTIAALLTNPATTAQKSSTYN